MMELKEFIKDTISQIGEAIDELNQEKRNFVVNPRDGNARSDTSAFTKSNNYRRKTRIDFHLALGVTEGGENSGKIGILFSWIGVGGETKKENQSNYNNSIDFFLDVAFKEGDADSIYQ